MRNSIFSNNEFYHVYNRGTDKRKVFLKKSDYQRFIDGMEIFNTTEPVGHLMREEVVEAKPRQEDNLVNIVAYCLMSNHFHLLLEQVKDNGISKFLQKLSTGYTMYFNKRYERSGVLFQGVFKSRHVNSDKYLLHLSRYIHLNPLEILDDGCTDKGNADGLLRRYDWSSYLEYVDKSKKYFITNNRNIILDQLGGWGGYRDFVLDLVGKQIDSSRFRLDK